MSSKIVELDLIDHRTNEKVKMITNKPNNQLKEIQDKFNKIAIDRSTLSEAISTDPNQQDYYTRQMFANIRLRNAPSHQTIDELIRAAERSIQLNRYRAAAYSLTLAIDRIQIENPTFNIKKEERIKLSRIVKQRASSYLKYAEEEQSVQVTKMALVDCAFILETGVFKLNELPRDVKREINYIKDKALALENFLNLRQMRRDARQMRRAERASEQIITRPNRRRREQQNNGQQAASCGSIDVFLCNQVHELDDLFTDHLCPICQNPWKDFFDPSFAVKFSCKHAFCAACIVGQFEVAKLEYSCGMCRAPIPEYLKQVSFINFSIS
jgi:rubrerythrin